MTTRREFLRQSARYAGSVPLLAPSLAGRVACSRGVVPSPASPAADRRAGLGAGGDGPLRPAGPEHAQPEGFRYTVLSR
ncbi:MAG: hypothetical protein ACXW61_07370, partial [Gemmatirosa sp.]